MHLIPESWTHLHILVSVFPSVGLLFLLGFYVTGMATANEQIKRFCLIVLGILGILAIPTYYSGEYAIAPLMQSDMMVSEDRINAHFMWGIFGLGSLVITGATAWYLLYKNSGGKPLSRDASHLMLGLSLITLLLMIAVGEGGWEIKHHELQVEARENTIVSAGDVPIGIGTPQSWSHVHMILNHFPTVGFVFGLGFFILAILKNNDVLKRAGLTVFAICGVLGAPTYVTGAASMWALTDPPILNISQAAINAHRDMAAFSLIGLAFTGVTAWIQLWRYRYTGKFSNTTIYLVLAFAVITLGLMAETGHRGGQINHPEIRTEPLPTDPNAFMSPAVEILINNVIWFVPWQTVHFFGYSLVFGTVLAVALRILGFWKSMPFSAVHRLLPLGVFGVVMNIFTGMLMLMADTFRYVNENAFPPKMFFLPIGAIAVLYFSLSDRVWAVKAGEDAPMTAKWVAALVLFSWAAVIMGGRLLPYV